MKIITAFRFTILIPAFNFLSCRQNTASQEQLMYESDFSLSITSYNHAEEIFNGIMTYTLKNDTLKIHRSFMFSDKDTLLFSKKIDNKSINRIQNIRLDSLKDLYFNYCVMTTSGNEYYISTTIEDRNKTISLHHYYNEQIERLINELNYSIPAKLKLVYLTKDTKQDCEM